MRENNPERSHNHYCYGTAIMPSLSIFVALHVIVNHIKPLSVATETQEWVPLAPLSSYEMLRTAVNHTRVFRASCTVPDIFVRF